MEPVPLPEWCFQLQYKIPVQHIQARFVPLCECNLLAFFNTMMAICRKEVEVLSWILTCALNQHNLKQWLLQKKNCWRIATSSASEYLGFFSDGVLGSHWWRQILKIIDYVQLYTQIINLAFWRRGLRLISLHHPPMNLNNSFWDSSDHPKAPWSKYQKYHPIEQHVGCPQVVKPLVLSPNIYQQVVFENQAQ